MKDGKAPVYACITVNGKKSMLATKQKISVKCWDANKGLGKSTTAEGKEVNAYLDQVRQSIGNAIRNYRYKGDNYCRIEVLRRCLWSFWMFDRVNP